MAKGSSCIFCTIASSNANFIYQDDKCVAILDKFPVSRGHLLLMPKEHVSDLTFVSDEIAARLGIVLKKLVKRVDSVLKPDGIKVVSNIREAAGQGIFHLHIHIIPVYGKSNDPYASEIGVQKRTKWEDDKGIIPTQKELSESDALELFKLLKLKD